MNKNNQFYLANSAKFIENSGKTKIWLPQFGLLPYKKG